jgi:lyso-ornithine lipid O-acyltransferase
VIDASVRAVLYLALTFVLIPPQLLIMALRPQQAGHIPHFYCRMICRILRVQVKVKGDVPQNAALIVANHVSWIDIPLLGSIAPLSFIAKKEVSGWPLFGFLAKLQRTVFVDREKKQSTAKSRDELQARLRQGNTLVLFPEGTSHNGHGMLPFKSSFFAAAASPDVAIVPVTLAYRSHWGLPMMREERPIFAWYGDIDLPPHLWSMLQAGPLSVDAIFHPALDPETGLDRKKASRASERIIREGLAAALHGR